MKYLISRFLSVNLIIIADLCCDRQCCRPLPFLQLLRRHQRAGQRTPEGDCALTGSRRAE